VASVNDYGGAGDPLATPPLGGPEGWAAAVAAALDLRDESVDERLAALEAATRTPVGTIVAFGGSAAPAGWHLCDGSAHGSAALQAVIGSASAPDLRDRFLVGASATKALGSTGGAETHNHTAPVHSHTGPSHTHTGPSHTHTGPSHTHVGGNHRHETPWPLWPNTSGSGGPHSHSPWNTPVFGITGNYRTYPNYGAAAGYTGQGSALGGYPMLTNYAYDGLTTSAGGTGATGAGGTGATGASGTANTGNSAAANTGSGDSKPPYYALTYIIRKD